MKKDDLTTNADLGQVGPPEAKHLLANAVQVRSCSEICIDADKHSDDLGYLSDLWKEVVSNKYEYCLVELKFMLEHLENYAKEMGRRDAKELKQLLADGGFYGFR